MVAYKNNPTPGKEKMYQGRKYQLYSSITDIPVRNTSLDRLAQTPANNESYQHATETLGKRITRGINPDELVYSSYVTHPARQEKTCPAGLDELSQPIWFYMIMKKLAAKKEKKE